MEIADNNKNLINNIIPVYLRNCEIIMDDSVLKLISGNVLGNRTYLKEFHHPDLIAILNGNNLKCRKHIRLSYRSFIRVLEEITDKRHGWGKQFEVMIFLLWIASGASYRVISLSTGVPKSTVFDITTNILRQLISKLHKFIKLPTSENLPAIGEGFARMGKSCIFLKAAGALDGTYINVKCPPSLHDQYITRKLTYSIQLQAICDHKEQFLDIFVGYPGSVHDQRVFINSPFYRKGTYPPGDTFILADNGYALKVHPFKVLVPYKNYNYTQLSRQQINFNHHHSLARNIIERSFGMMKMRWRYIFKQSELKIKKSIEVAAACCILHNICCMENDAFNPDEESSVEDEMECPINLEIDEESSEEFRNSLCTELNNEING